ncbi:MAG TPA: VOC family protein [Candidatus Acidoferrales bacterium]|nr:VOC family protein [Candidatus Acidoferrales bacterium]
MPAVTGVLETCLYVEDLEVSARFYEGLFGWTPMFGDERMRAYGVAPGSVLLLFKQGATREAVQAPGGVIPAHDGTGGGHVAFAIAGADWEAWEKRLGARGIAMERVVNWPRGGRSVYFRDPDQNLVELATPGLWEVY